MGLFGGDSKSKQTSTQSSTGAQTQAGDPTSINTGGASLKKSKIKINVIKTDHGAVKGGLRLAAKTLHHNQRALDSAFDFGGESLEFAENTQQRAFSMFDATLDSINQTSSDAIQEVASFAEKSAANPDGKLQNVTLMGFAMAVLVVLGPSLIERMN